MIDKTEIRARVAYLIEHVEGGNVSAMARKIGASPVLVTDWVKGKSTPKIDYRRKICDAYNVSLDWITGTVKLSQIEQHKQQTATHSKATEQQLIATQLELKMYQEMYGNLKLMYDQLIQILNKDKR